MSTRTLQDLGKRVIIGSGAVGTCLRADHGAVASVELLNITHPDWIEDLHRAYKSAGSQVLVTNTFAANPLALEDIAQDHRCEEINSAGVKLARAAASDDCMVWSSVGPLSLGLGIEDFSDEQLAEIYTRQLSSLADADAVVLETFTQIREARAAASAATRAGLPFILQTGNLGNSPGQWGRLEEFIELAASSGASAIGSNCRHPDSLFEVCRYLLAKTDLPVTASPNAGQPVIVRGAVGYDFSPDNLYAMAEKLIDLGVSVVGGCCGTSPDHIRRISELSERPVGDRSTIQVRDRPVTEVDRTRSAGANRIRELVESDKFLMSVEIRAARTESLSEIVEGARQIAESGVHMFDVPDNPGASVGRDAAVVAAALQNELGIPSLCHMTVTQSNLLRMHSTLIGCGDLGLQGVLAITGDPPGMGDLAHSANRVKDLRSSVELLRLIRKMRAGQSAAEQRIESPPDLCPGCSVKNSSDAQIKWLRKKVDAGAEFIYSQPMFTFDDYERLVDALSEFDIRLFPGLMPLAGKRNAEFLASGRIPGIKVPQELVERFGQYKDRASQRDFGMEYATELALKIAEHSRGLYIIMPFGKSCYTDTARITGAVTSAVSA